MNVILCGTHWAGCKALELLLKEGHNVFVYTAKKSYDAPCLVEYAKKRGVPYSLQDISKDEFCVQPDLVCSIWYYYILKPHVIAACNGKVFNLHPALLPKYRGCSSIPWAMIEGEKSIGYTYHYIEEGIDTGKILLQRAMPLEDWDTQSTLFHKLMYEAMKDFLTVVELVMKGEPGSIQSGESSYNSRRCPYGGEIDPSWDLAKKERFIRAMIYPPYPVATYMGKPIHSMEELLMYEKAGSVELQSQ